MFSNRSRVFSICLAGLLSGPVLLPAVLAAHEVQLIFGSGFRPADLQEGSRPSAGTWIEADSRTIVVLMRTWTVEKRMICEDWVIVRGQRYQVEGSPPAGCPERGRGNELERAMAGESLVARLTVLGFNDPKADAPAPEKLSSLQKDLETLRRRTESRPRPRPPAPAPVRGLIKARQQTSACLHRKLGSWDNGNPIHLWSCAAGNSSMKSWNYDPATGYIRSAANPAKCWHKKYGDWSNGNPIHLWDCDAGPAAHKTWSYSPASGLIRARGNGAKCIHKKEGGFQNGNPVHLWDCDAGVPAFKTWIVTE